jgi:hypothetical protein
MEPKQIEIRCPCCSSRILVDVRTSQILRTMRPEERDDQGRTVVRESDWDAAAGRVRERIEKGEDRLSSALERERERDSRLDELFKKAAEKVEPDEDDGEPA